MAYIVGPKSPGCIFCNALIGDRRSALVLGTTQHSIVMLNRYPYQSGHLMVAPRTHTADLPGLPAEAYGDLAESLRRTLASLSEALHPDGMNVGLNLGRCAGAGVLDHLHWHLVPRWDGDTNFMPVLADVRVVPQHLDETCDRLRPYFAWLDRAEPADC